MNIKLLSKAETLRLFNLDKMTGHASFYMKGYNECAKIANSLCEECFITCGYCGTINRSNNQVCKHCKIEL